MIGLRHSVSLIFLASSLLFANSAGAQTCTVAGDAGKLWYNPERYLYCNGVAWQEVDNGPTANTCVAGDAGKMEYSGGVIRYCNGRNWRTTKGASNGSCAGTTAGTYNYSGGFFQFCDGTNWYKMLQVPPATIDGYILRSSTTYNGNLGGIAGADATCLADLTAVGNNWKGKATAQANGQLIAAKVKAFICDNTTCNNLVANKVYAFGRSSASLAGGMWMTTDGSGRGPQDNSAWQAYNYFDAGSSYWTGLRDTVSATVWGTTTTGATNNQTCSNWSTALNTVTGVYASATSTSSSRWNSSTMACDQLRYLVCIVNP